MGWTPSTNSNMGCIFICTWSYINCTIQCKVKVDFNWTQRDAGLALDPLIGAISAGNAVVLKPSEMAPACASLLTKYLPIYLDNKAVKVFEGGPMVGQQLLEQRWDKIFFTGMFHLVIWLWNRQTYSFLIQPTHATCLPMYGCLLILERCRVWDLHVWTMYHAFYMANSSVYITLVEVQFGFN